MAKDFLAVIHEAGHKGISFSKLGGSERVKIELQKLRNTEQIAGPFKYGRGELYFTKGLEPSAETTAKLIEEIIGNNEVRLFTSASIKEQIQLPFKLFFQDGVRHLVALGRVAVLKSGSSKILFHINSADNLFPSLRSSRLEDQQKKTAFNDNTVLTAYNELKREQGGFSAVSIAKLLNRLGCVKNELHDFLLKAAQANRADLHPSNSVDLDQSEKDAAVQVPGRRDPAVTVTFKI